MSTAATKRPRPRRWLIDAREKAGLSQYEMASLLEMPRSTYANIELGTRPLRIELAGRIAVQLKTTIDALYFGPTGPKTEQTECV